MMALPPPSKERAAPTTNINMPAVASDHELEVTSKPVFEFDDEHPTAALPSRPKSTPPTPSPSPTAVANEAKKKKKPKWTKEMKKARDAAALTVNTTGNIEGKDPLPERNGLEKSPLNNIPGELRNEIYELVLQVSDFVYLSPAYNEGQGGSCHRGLYGRKPLKKKNLLAIMRVCYQIHAESTAAFYGCNEFIVPSRFDAHGYNMSPGYAQQLARDLRPAQMWLKHIGSFNRSHLKHLYIDLETWSTSWDHEPEGTKDDRGWLTGALRSVSKQLLKTGVSPESVFLRVTAELAVPRTWPREKNVCSHFNIGFPEYGRLVFMVPVVRNKEKAKAAVNSAYTKHLDLLNAHAEHPVKRSSHQPRCYLARRLGFFQTHLIKARDRMLYAVGGSDANDEAIETSPQATARPLCRVEDVWPMMLELPATTDSAELKAAIKSEWQKKYDQLDQHLDHRCCHIRFWLSRLKTKFQHVRARMLSTLSATDEKNEIEIEQSAKEQ